VFVGPAPAGAVRIEAEVLRVGRAVTVASARLWSADKIAATLTGIYGTARSSAMAIPATAAAAIAPVQVLPSMPPPDRAPAFVRHFDFRWAEGAALFSGSSLRTSKTYVRHTDPGKLTESHVIALIDCIPSAILQMMSNVAPSSSLTWNTQFLKHDYSFAPDAWWRIDAEIDAAADGYSCESCVLLDPDGVPAALSRQIVAFFG
jgi:hypothetical protein